VDDEPDVLDSLAELLDVCELDQAKTYDQALELLDQRSYDAAILDIMGVGGYGLLEKTAEREIPTLMLTAHALSPDDFVPSIRGGAEAYPMSPRIGSQTSPSLLRM
jgi:DNA-binding response OmpR family regulator